MYKTVAERIEEFHIKYPNGNIVTKIDMELTTPDLIVIPDVELPQRQFTGYAEELRGSSQINKTSALENCETSCVGRALAFAGFGGTEIASANEVEQAIAQQGKKPPAKKSAAKNASSKLTDKDKMVVIELMAELEKCTSVEELALCASSLNKTHPKLEKKITDEVNIGYKQIYDKLKKGE